MTRALATSNLHSFTKTSNKRQPHTKHARKIFKSRNATKENLPFSFSASPGLGNGATSFRRGEAQALKPRNFTCPCGGCLNQKETQGLQAHRITLRIPGRTYVLKLQYEGKIHLQIAPVSEPNLPLSHHPVAQKSLVEGHLLLETNQMPHPIMANLTS
jgi:hypothetical protein